MKELWYVSCSPRNPKKIKKELEWLATLEGQEWNKKDQEGNKVTQLKFAKMLRDLAEFEGKASGKESDFSARDRVAPMKTYGFVYTDKQGRLRITKAGKALINGEDEQHIFLMQMLKWQYPSSQHCGKEYLGQPATLFENKKLGFLIIPFIFTLQVVNLLGGVTKREIAIFLLPNRRMNRIFMVVKKIHKYRQERETKVGRSKKLEYDEMIHNSLYKKIYSTTLSKCVSRKAKKGLLKKKVSNSRDVADACIRLFRHTGLFTTKRDRIIFNNTRINEIKLILNQKWRPVNFFKDKVRFYKYFGNHEKPDLPFHAPQFLVKRIFSLKQEMAKLLIPKSKLQKIPRFKKAALLKKSKSNLLKIVSEFTKHYREAKRWSIFQFLHTTGGQRDVLDVYDAITHREVHDPPTFFEWNNWRAMIALDRCTRINAYMMMDDELQPVNCARGNVPDILVEFDKYVVAVEVTLSSGRRQYMTETEPVTFHVGKCQHEENYNGNKRKVYGLFIAPKINKHTAQYFLQYIDSLEVPDYGNVTVIPFDLVQWIDILSFANSISCLKTHQLGELLASIEDASKNSSDVDEWLNSFPISINKWKNYVKKS
ncbi:AlwI family type II restriction endonuclease [Planctomycetota bacterium]